MSNCGEIQNTILTPDKVLKVLIRGSPSLDESQYVGIAVTYYILNKNALD